MATAGAATFDAVDQNLDRGAEFDGPITNSKQWTGMVYWNRDASGAIHQLYSIYNERTRIQLQANDELRLSAKDTVGTLILQVDSVATYADTTSWHVLLFSIDLATSTEHFYVDDVSDAQVGVSTNLTIDFANVDHYVGSNEAPAGFMDGCIGPLWLAAGLHLDLSVESNRRLFHTSAADGLKLASKLNTDSTNPGATPYLWLNNPTATYHTNLGSGGGMTVNNGPLTACTGPEIDSSVPILRRRREFIGVH